MNLKLNRSIIKDPTAMGMANPTIAGLKNNGLLINCSVVSQPKK
jgi:hypothetical protein